MDDDEGVVRGVGPVVVEVTYDNHDLLDLMVRALAEGPYGLGPPFTMSDTRPGAPVSSLRTTPMRCSVMKARKK